MSSSDKPAPSASGQDEGGDDEGEGEGEGEGEDEDEDEELEEDTELNARIEQSAAYKQWVAETSEREKATGLKLLLLGHVPRPAGSPDSWTPSLDDFHATPAVWVGRDAERLLASAERGLERIASDVGASDVAPATRAVRLLRSCVARARADAAAGSWPRAFGKLVAATVAFADDLWWAFDEDAAQSAREALGELGDAWRRALGRGDAELGVDAAQRGSAAWLLERFGGDLAQAGLGLTWR
eukprot:m51a1_g14041 hypothetical protein (241) ;mRNA; f:1175520-1176242